MHALESSSLLPQQLRLVFRPFRMRNIGAVVRSQDHLEYYNERMVANKWSDSREPTWPVAPATNTDGGGGGLGQADDGLYRSL